MPKNGTAVSDTITPVWVRVRVRVRVMVMVGVRVRVRARVGVRQQEGLHRKEQRLYIVAEQRGRRVGGEQPQRVVRGGAKGVAVEGDEDVGVARDELEALLEAPETAARAPDRHLVRVRVRVRVRVGVRVRDRVSEGIARGVGSPI